MTGKTLVRYLIERGVNDEVRIELWRRVHMKIDTVSSCFDLCQVYMKVKFFYHIMRVLTYETK